MARKRLVVDVKISTKNPTQIIQVSQLCQNVPFTLYIIEGDKTCREDE